MSPGDTFRFQHGTHLLLVLSDPEIDPDHVLIASITSNMPDKDQACVLRTGDHRFLRKESVVHYGLAKVYADRFLNQELAAGRLTLDEPLSLDILMRAREGARISNRIKLDHRQLLVDQGLIN